MLIDTNGLGRYTMGLCEIWVIVINKQYRMPQVQTVKVMVRVRPLNKREAEQGNQMIATANSRTKEISICKPLQKEDPKTFTFDYVFGQDSSQQTIYQQSSFRLVNSVIEGYNGTIFAYGQTGCGKTFTMMGDPSSEEIRGIIPRTFSQIMAVTGAESKTKYLVRCSFIEIYNEEIHDMLSQNSKAKMELREAPNKGIYVQNLTIQVVKTTEEMENYMSIGFKNRAVRETAMNKESSRSHSVFTIFIESEETDEKGGGSRFKGAKLNLVDLAGSEKQKQTNAVGDGLREAAKINLSLSALGNVISALVDGKFIPYRDSKLTRILQDSLGGNTKTIMIANISPSADSYEQSLSTLRYASRAKFIKNKPKVNEDPKDALLREYAQQVKALKLMLQGKIPIDPKMATLASQKKRTDKENQNELQQQLRKKEILLNNEKQERAKIMFQLQQLQKITSHQAPTASSKMELEKIKKLNQKLELQKKKEEDYFLEKKRRDEDLVDIDKKYKSLNEEVDYMKERFKEVKNKYMSCLTELKDIQAEHESEKVDLLDTVRYQQAEIAKYNEILSMMISPEQVEKISRLSEWDEDTMEHKLPFFYLRDKAVMFPKMGQAQARQYIQNQKLKKQIVFRRDSFELKRTNQNESFKQLKSPTKEPNRKGSNKQMELNMILKGAKNHFSASLDQTVSSKNGLSGVQLSPIKGEIQRKRAERQQKTNSIRLNPIQEIGNRS